jgi:MerR family transcriptional regulator, copper efflux regulator
MDQPIACILTPAAYRERTQTVERIARSGLRARLSIDGGTRLTFDAGAENALRELIAAEAECCPFLRMTLTRSGDALTLEVTGPEDAQPIIAELFD